MYALQLNLFLEILCTIALFLMIFGKNVGKPFRFMLCMSEYCVQHEMFALDRAIKVFLVSIFRSSFFKIKLRKSTSNTIFTKNIFARTFPKLNIYKKSNLKL